MWTEITRPHYERSGRRYASDATDAEWSHIAPLLPSAKPGGRPRTMNLRDVFDAILYMASTGCQWRMLPIDYPPVSTVRRYFYDWRDNGVLRTINHYLVMATPEAMGREASPTAGVVERTFAWLGRCRRLAKDWERTIASAETWLLVAHIRRVTRLLART